MKHAYRFGRFSFARKTCAHHWRSRLMKRLSDVKFSTLDLVPVRENGSAGQSLRNSLDLAQHAEKFGYTRFWVAEHHNMDGIACSANSVLLGYLAGGMSTIRDGSGWVLLPY